MTSQLLSFILVTTFVSLATMAGARAAELEVESVSADGSLLSGIVGALDDSPVVAELDVACGDCDESCAGGCASACNDGCSDDSDAPSVSFGDWVGYNPAQSNTTWLAGDDFGMFSMESFPTLEFGKDSAVLFGTGLHFLDGPAGRGIDAPDMPPRLFDLHTAFHVRKRFNSQAMLDVKLGVGLFTDFEGSARKGLRFPGHVVGYNEISPTLVSVLGIEVLDRDDISVLPVAGIVWRPHPEFIVEAVFPRPRISLSIDGGRAIYVGGELGGGTWAIQRDSERNDNVTYRDLRVVWGIEKFGKGGDSTLELGWAFDRSLEYRSRLGNTDLDGAFILRWHTHF